MSVVAVIICQSTAARRKNISRVLGAWDANAVRGPGASRLAGWYTGLLQQSTASAATQGYQVKGC